MSFFKTVAADVSGLKYAGYQSELTFAATIFGDRPFSRRSFSPVCVARNRLAASSVLPTGVAGESPAFEFTLRP